jgi:hypothetical protein
MSQPNGLVLSVVVPARNEAENWSELVPEIAGAVDGLASEIVIVDDGSTDDAEAVLDKLWRAGLLVRRVAHRTLLGQSAALMTGVLAARAAVVATLDGDGQNDPRFIPEMVKLLADPSVGLVSGQRVGHKDTAAKRLGSRLANRIRRAMRNDGTRDTGCGLKAFAASRSCGFLLPDHAPFLAGALSRGWLACRPCRRDRPAPPPRPVQLRPPRPACGRGSRPLRGSLAAPPPPAQPLPGRAGRDLKRGRRRGSGGGIVDC